MSDHLTRHIRAARYALAKHGSELLAAKSAKARHTAERRARAARRELLASLRLADQAEA